MLFKGWRGISRAAAEISTAMMMVSWQAPAGSCSVAFGDIYVSGRWRRGNRAALRAVRGDTTGAAGREGKVPASLCQLIGPGFLSEFLLIVRCTPGDLSGWRCGGQAVMADAWGTVPNSPAVNRLRQNTTVGFEKGRARAVSYQALISGNAVRVSAWCRPWLVTG